MEEKLMNLIAVYYTESGLENLRFRRVVQFRRGIEISIK